MSAQSDFRQVLRDNRGAVYRGQYSNGYWCGRDALKSEILALLAKPEEIFGQNVDDCGYEFVLDMIRKGIERL